jgi:uncharacterized alpha-E superfamily protein
VLLSRAAAQLYWAARYLERAEDTARLVRSFTEVLIDLPVRTASSWQPLLAVFGATTPGEEHTETEVVSALLADPLHPGSVIHSVAAARNNLRTTRELIPVEAWQAINDLHLYVQRDPTTGVPRQSRGRFCDRLIGEAQRIDGIITGAMSRDEAYELWRLGETVERADMTTRILGVRAAALLHGGAGANDGVVEPGGAADTDSNSADVGVQWMGVLRSLAAMQMFQRSNRAPISGAAVVDFLLHDVSFPRSVSYAAQRMVEAFRKLPHNDSTLLPTLRLIDELSQIRSGNIGHDGSTLDAAVDMLQQHLGSIDRAIADAFFLPSADMP